MLRNKIRQIKQTIKNGLILYKKEKTALHTRIIPIHTILESDMHEDKTCVEKACKRSEGKR